MRSTEDEDSPKGYRSPKPATPCGGAGRKALFAGNSGQLWVFDRLKNLPKGKRMSTLLDILILASILVLAVLAVRSLKKSGRRCSCGCSGCAMAGKCAKDTREEEKHE